MSDGTKDQTSRSYFVPCVLTAVEIIDALRDARAGLRVEDLRSAARGSRSTVYRIVRTLSRSGYILRDELGCYHLNSGVFQFSTDPLLHQATSSRNGTSPSPQESYGEFERWGVRFRAEGIRGNTAERNIRPTQRDLPAPMPQPAQSSL
jgi:hypothetical protein